MAIEKKSLLKFLMISAILIVIMVTVPKTIGLSREGFDVAEVLRQYFFYAVTGIASLLGILFLFLYENQETEKDTEYGSGLAFSSQGEKPAFPFFKRMSQFQIFLASFIIFCFIGLFTYVSRQTTFTGIALLAQQFTEIDSLLFSSFLIPIAENLDLMFVLALGIFALRRIAKRDNWEPTNFVGLSYLLVFLGGLFGVANHLLRYGGSDLDLLIVYSFWTIGSFITLATGSFFPFLCMHFANNFFFDLGRFLSNETLVIYTGSFLLLLAVVYFFIYRDGLLGKKGGG
jgi:hypothetical protein